MKGFTLVELIIVIGITAIVVVFITVNFFGFKGKNDLDLTAQEIVSVLRNAQDRSISQESDSQWGVHFENPAVGDSFYALFSGAVYNNNPISKFILRSNIQFVDPASGNNKDVIFNKLTGVSALAVVSISLKNNPSIIINITINNNGQIQY